MMPEKLKSLTELMHMLKSHNIVTFTLTGLGETILETSYFADACEELKELEHLAEIGRATEKAFEGIYAELLIHDIWPSGDNKGTERIASVAELLEWAAQEGKAGEGTE